MKISKRGVWPLAGLAVLAAGVIGVLWHSGGPVGPSNAPPMCLLWGSAQKAGTAQATGFGALSGAIRRRFEAQTSEDCLSAAEDYCQTEILDQGGIPHDLHGAFHDVRTEGGVRMHFTVDEDCEATASPGD